MNHRLAVISVSGIAVCLVGGVLAFGRGLLQGGVDGEVREEILEYFDGPQPTDSWSTPPDVEALLSQPKAGAVLREVLAIDQTPRRRIHAAWALRYQLSGESVNALCRALVSDADGDVRVNALWTLEAFGQRLPEAARSARTQCLQEALHDSDRGVRAQAKRVVDALPQ